MLMRAAARQGLLRRLPGALQAWVVAAAPGAATSAPLAALAPPPAAAAPGPPPAAAAAEVLARRFSTAQAGAPSPGDAGEAAAEEILFAVDRLLGEGDCESAAAMLEAGAARVIEEYGPDTRGLLHIFGQLALLRFVEGNYEAALHAAQRCYSAALRKDGEGSRRNLPHAVRYGVMLLASGDAEGALPLLQHSGRQLQVVVQELGAAAAALPSQAELDQLQLMMEQLFDYAVALGEATFYESLCRIAHNGSCKDTVLREEEGLLEGLEMLKHALAQDHIILGAALREHSRLVRRCQEREQRLVYTELALQNKRLHDTMRAGVLEFDETEPEDE